MPDEITEDGGNVRFERRGELGLITLDRPKALNALTHGMVRAITRQLEEWARDDAVTRVAVTGEGRAFCAGGDIRAIHARGVAGDPYDEFFADEYALNIAVHDYPKPYVAIIDGLVMGGGVGVSFHGSYVVVTQNARFAMPECSIGFFPDVGASVLLNRIRPEIGMMLGLSGERVGAEEMVALGLAHALLPDDAVENVVAALASGEDVADAVSLHQRKVDGAASGRLAALAAPFANGSLEQAFERLEPPSLEPVRKALDRACPVSLLVAWRQLGSARGLLMQEAMAVEARIAHAMLRSSDFYEGIRAAVIDKTGDPKWSHEAIKDVSDSEVERFFEPVTDGPLAALGGAEPSERNS